MRTKSLLVFALLALPAVPARAISSRAGTSGAQFLKLGAGSRAGAMAEAYSAMAGDVYAVYYNPAGLTRLTRPQLAASHVEHFQDVKYEFGAFAFPFARAEDHSRHVFAFALYSLGVQDIDRRTDDTEVALGTFDAGDYAYDLTYAYRAHETLSLGLSGKLIQQKIDSYSADAYAVDAGLLWTPRPDAKRPYSISLVVKNAGSEPSFAGGVSDPLPMAVVAGFGMEVVPRFKLDLDVTKYRDNDVITAIGGEYLYPFSDDVSAAMRFGGTTHRRDNQGFNEATLGLGLNFHRASFDFAWVPYGVLGNTFRYSLLIQF